MGEWLTVREAATLLGCTEGHMRYLVSHEQIESRKADRRRLVSKTSVTDRVVEAQTWISWAEAAALADCGDGIIAYAVRTGRIQRRPVANRSERSLLRASVLAFAQERAATALAQARRARDRQDWKLSAQPPDDGHVWLTRQDAAAVLGVSINRVSQLARDGLVPHLRRRHRVWFRRDHLEQVAAARRLNQRRSDPG